jgi:hypothetical protein
MIRKGYNDTVAHRRVCSLSRHHRTAEDLLRCRRADGIKISFVFCDLVYSKSYIRNAATFWFTLYPTVSNGVVFILQ